MEKKSFLAGRGVGYYLALPALVFGVLAYVLYAKNGITEFNPSLSQKAIIAVFVGAALCLVSLFFECKPVKYLAYLAYLYAFMAFLNSQITYIVNVFVSIDGSTFSAGFILTAVSFLLAMLLALVAAILTKHRGDAA